MFNLKLNIKNENIIKMYDTLVKVRSLVLQILKTIQKFINTFIINRWETLKRVLLRINDINPFFYDFN